MTQKQPKNASGLWAVDDIPALLTRATRKLNLLLISRDPLLDCLHIHLGPDINSIHETDLVDVVAIIDIKNDFLILGFAGKRELYKFGQTNISELMIRTDVVLEFGINAEKLDSVLRQSTWVNEKHGIYYY